MSKKVWACVRVRGAKVSRPLLFADRKSALDFGSQRYIWNFGHQERWGKSECNGRPSYCLATTEEEIHVYEVPDAQVKP